MHQTISDFLVRGTLWCDDKIRSAKMWVKLGLSYLGIETELASLGF